VPSWIFQGHPDQEDMDAVAQGGAIRVWRIGPRHLASRMRVGDLVYMWRSAGRNKARAGVVARGRISAEPSEPDATVEVELEDNRVEPRFLSRIRLKQDPVFQGARILRFAQSTTFELSSAEGMRLEELWRLPERLEPWFEPTFAVLGLRDVLQADLACLESLGVRRHSLTTLRDRIRLNVGRVEVGTFSADEVRLLLFDEGEIPNTAGVQLEVSPYRSVLPARIASIEASSLTHAWPVLRAAHFAFIERAHGTGALHVRHHNAPLADWVRGKKVALGTMMDEVTYDPSRREPIERRTAEVIRRHRQDRFRDQLLSIWRACAISGCSIETALEAAHIVPHSEQGSVSMHPRNGLILRADLHNLFDAGLLRIDPETLRVRVSPVLSGSEYATFEGRELEAPPGIDLRPALRARSQS
jgi:HNH endonuclease/EVE domain